MHEFVCIVNDNAKFDTKSLLCESIIKINGLEN